VFFHRNAVLKVVKNTKYLKNGGKMENKAIIKKVGQYGMVFA